jgi:transposase
MHSHNFFKIGIAFSIAVIIFFRNPMREKIDIHQEQNIERLRQLALKQEEELQLITELLVKDKAEIRRLREMLSMKQQNELSFMKDLLRKRERALFGDKSEKRPRTESVTSVLEEPPKSQTPRQGHGPTPQPQLEVVERVHELDEPDMTCPKCGDRLQEWSGQFETSEVITSVERQYVVVKEKRKKYRCRCNGCVETAPSPYKLKPGSRYTPEFAVDVAVAKYLDHLPLQRQVGMMARQGLKIKANTLWDQLKWLTTVLEPSYQKLIEEVQDSDMAYADETWWRLMDHKKGLRKKHWMWAMANDELVAYRILDSRSKEAAAKLLGQFNGTLMADGYSSYGALAREGPQMDLGDKSSGTRFRLANCWVHARRKFIEVEENFPEPCAEILDLIGQLYGVERKVPKNGDPQEREAKRHQLRQEESMVILKEIRAWVERQRVLPQSGLGKAIAYMMDLWPGLTAFVDDPSVPLDNNHIERALRGPVVGRKNHYGSRSENGTHVAEVLYSLLESAKLSGVEPRTYLLKATWCALESPGLATLPDDILDS